jgi:hypothetical protein
MHFDSKTLQDDENDGPTRLIATGDRTIGS